MIVVDTNVLVYAVGADHPLREPCRRLVAAAGDGRLDACTTVEAVQEFVHVRARARGRADAVELGRRYAVVFAPLLSSTPEALGDALRLYARNDDLDAFDALLAATALRANADAVVSADSAFDRVRGLKYFAPDSQELDRLVSRAGG